MIGKVEHGSYRLSRGVYLQMLMKVWFPMNCQV